MHDSSLMIDDFGPLPLRQPGSIAEVGDCVREAAAGGQAAYPVGGRTMLELGNAPTKPGIAVDLTRLSQVVDYPARDMTVTVQAGIRIAHLQQLLALENQQLPIDVPHAERATLGGAIACNVSGSWRLGYGTLRDYVLGIHAINDEGVEFKAGGRVVKNVAGYDICKLLVGSLGTLGIITQATVKLRPLPEEQALVALSCPEQQLAELLELLHGSQTRPACLDVFSRRGAALLEKTSGIALRDAPWLVVAGFDGNNDAVRWQVQQLILELRGRFPLDAWLGRLTGPFRRVLADFPLLGPDDGLTFKASVRPAQVAAFCIHAAGLADLALQAHAGNGVVRGHVHAEQGRAGAVLTTLRDLASQGGGSVVVTRCPAAWKPGLDIWGYHRPDVSLLRRIKEQFDPRRLFNPGRFVDAI